MLLLLAVLRMGAERSEDRSYLPPCCSVRSGELHRRECLAGNPVQDPSVVTFLSNFTARDQWWEAPGGHASVWTRRPKAEDLASMDPEKVPFETCLLQKPGEFWTMGYPRPSLSRERGPGGRASSYGASHLPAGWSAAVGRPPDSINTVSNPCYHIVESWDIEKMEEPPTDEAFGKDLRDRHKKACPHLLDHLVSLEAFLDKSIIFRLFLRNQQGRGLCFRRQASRAQDRTPWQRSRRGALPGCCRLPSVEGEVAHTAVLGLRELAPWVPPCGVRPRGQSLWPMAEARGSVPGGRAGFSRL